VIMASDDGFVIVESDLTPSPETSPEEKNVDERTYEEFINEKTPMETFNINGLRYYVKNGTSAEKVRTMMKAHGNCEICSSRARKYCTLLGRMKDDNDIHRSVFLKNIRGPKDGGCPDCCLFNIRKEVEKMNTPTNFKNPRMNM
jgi:hypothetical protein